MNKKIKAIITVIMALLIIFSSYLYFGPGITSYFTLGREKNYSELLGSQTL